MVEGEEGVQDEDRGDKAVVRDVTGRDSRGDIKQTEI